MFDIDGTGYSVMAVAGVCFTARAGDISDTVSGMHIMRGGVWCWALRVDAYGTQTCQRGSQENLPKQAKLLV